MIQMSLSMALDEPTRWCLEYQNANSRKPTDFVPLPSSGRQFQRLKHWVMSGPGIVWHHGSSGWTSEKVGVDQEKLGFTNKSWSLPRKIGVYQEKFGAFTYICVLYRPKFGKRMRFEPSGELAGVVATVHNGYWLSSKSVQSSNLRDKLQKNIIFHGKI